MISKNRKYGDVELILEERIEFGDGVRVHLDTGFPNPVTSNISSVVNIVEILLKYHQ